MRLLLLNTLYPPNQIGGAERSVQLIAETLARRGHDVAVLSLGPDGRSYTTELGGVRAHYVGLRNIYWPYGPEGERAGLRYAWHALDLHNLAMARAAARVAAQEKPDVIHTNNLQGFSTAVWPALSRQAPVVHTLRDYYLVCKGSSMFRKGKPCASQCTDCRLITAPRRAATRHVAAAVGISRFILDRHLEAGYFRDTAVRDTIPNPHGVTAREGPTRRRGPVLRLGYIGRLTSEKGIELLLRACSELHEERWELHVAGSGAEAYVRELQRRFPDPRVRWLGFTRADEFFADIDALVIPSLWHEPLGRSVLEAHAHGLPVIASRRGALPELVDDGVTGLVFDPDDIHGLQRCIGALMDDPELAASMGRRARESAKRYEPEPIARAYETVYERAAAGA